MGMKTLKILPALLLLAFTPAFARADTIDTLAKEAFIMDYDTGAVLLDKNADVKTPTSSMSKVLTIYLVFEALEQGKIKLDDTFPVSEKAWRMQGSKMFVPLNGRISVEDLIRGVVIQSGNDATIVLAEGLAGNEDAFATALNAKAQELGMKNSHFVNASGWPDPNHFSTARDLAIMTKSLIEKFPNEYKYFAEKEFVYNDIKQGNRNPLLYRNIGADGVKTGHTEDAGYGLIGTGVNNGRRVIVVINGTASQQERADESAKLLEWGLNRFENKKLVTAGAEIESAEVVLGKNRVVPLAVDHDVVMTVPRLTNSNVKMTLKYNGPLKAPVKKGQEVGKLTIEMPNMPPAEHPVLAAADVPQMGFFERTMDKARIMLLGH
jgi:D-alanyl-D-alanine carboxypeptidase (penicillin-binding protein 5/6)